MQRVIILTEEEYNQIKSKSPSNIVQSTLDNYKKSNELQAETIANLEAELNTYILGGATKRTQGEDVLAKLKDLHQIKLAEYATTYNITASALRTTAIKPVIEAISYYFNVDQLEIKRFLKDAVASGKATRCTKTNTYYIGEDYVNG